MIIPEIINVLYIEDDEQNADLILAFLSTSKITKFNVIHKNTLQKGIDYLKNELNDNLDVILLDLVLPHSEIGLDTFKLVLSKCGLIPIVVVSGYEEIACQCVKLGAQDYLYKPEFNAGTLIRSLKYAIERRKLVSNLVEREKKFRLLSEELIKQKLSEERIFNELQDRLKKWKVEITDRAYDEKLEIMDNKLSSLSKIMK